MLLIANFGFNGYLQPLQRTEPLYQKFASFVKRFFFIILDKNLNQC